MRGTVTVTVAVLAFLLGSMLQALAPATLTHAIVRPHDGSAAPRVLSTMPRPARQPITPGASPATTQLPQAPGAPRVPPGPGDPRLPAAPRTGVPIVVIDPGHGGSDAGVRGRSGAIEKRITLETARRLKTLLESRLGARVILTREDDVAVALETRTAIANTNRADLFISLHFNAAPSPDAAGAVVYSLLLDREGEQARQQARLAPAVPGTRALDIVPWEFAQAWHLDASSGLAALVAESLGRNAMLRSAAVRRAPLRVLGDVNAPAVLVELAYLTNAAQEQLAGSEEFATGVGEALVNALARFLGHAEGAGALP